MFMYIYIYMYVCMHMIYIYIHIPLCHGSFRDGSVADAWVTGEVAASRDVCFSFFTVVENCCINKFDIHRIGFFVTDWRNYLRLSVPPQGPEVPNLDPKWLNLELNLHPKVSKWGSWDSLSPRRAPEFPRNPRKGFSLDFLTHIGPHLGIFL